MRISADQLKILRSEIDARVRTYEHSRENHPLNDVVMFCSVAVYALVLLLLGMRPRDFKHQSNGK